MIHQILTYLWPFDPFLSIDTQHFLDQIYHLLTHPLSLRILYLLNSFDQVQHVFVAGNLAKRVKTHWQFVINKLVTDDTHRPNIHCHIVRSRNEHLRSHIELSPEIFRNFKELRLIIIQKLSTSKITDHVLTLSHHQNICRLQVSMNYPIFHQFQESLSYLQNERHDIYFIPWLLQILRQISSLYILCHNAVLTLILIIKMVNGRECIATPNSLHCFYFFLNVVQHKWIDVLNHLDCVFLSIVLLNGFEDLAKAALADGATLLGVSPTHPFTLHYLIQSNWEIIQHQAGKCADF